MLDLVVNSAVVIAAVVAVLLTARLALTPRLSIADFEGQTPDLQKGLPRIVHSELEILRAEGGGTSLRFMTGPDQPVAVPEPIPKLPGFASIAQLVSLLPRRVHSVDAFLHEDTPRGPALSIRLSRSALADGATTLYLDDLVKPTGAEPSPEVSLVEPPPNDPGVTAGAAGGVESVPEEEKPKPALSSHGSHPYHRLAVAAAAWLAFRLPRQGIWSSAAGPLTDSWESYALFRIGVGFQEGKDLASARRSYAWSLMQDPLNRGSLLNLAGLDIDTRCNGPAIDRLVLLCQLLPDVDFPRDRLWYRARFNLAVACLNEEDSLPGRVECATSYGPAARQEIAVAALDEIIDRSDDILGYYERAGIRAVRRTASAELLIFIRTVHDMAVVVRADPALAP